MEMLTPENANTGIRTVLESKGHSFWDTLPLEIQTINEPLFLETQALLLQYFPVPYRSPAVLPARLLGLQKATVRQTDDKNCTFVAVSNGLRILAGPDSEFTLIGLKKRYSQIYGHNLDQIRGVQSLEKLFSTGEPFDQFKALTIPQPLVFQRPFPMDMYSLLRKFQEGAVGILDWPYSPRHTLRQGINYTHSRTITGFTSTTEGIFFHIIDPYNPTEQPWSFRDLITAASFDMGYLNHGLKFDDYDFIARNVLIIERKKPSGIRAASSNS